MPRYTKETAEAKAAILIKPYIRNGLDQSKTARELGVTSEAINQRLKRKPVQDYLRRFIDSPHGDFCNFVAVFQNIPGYPGSFIADN